MSQNIFVINFSSVYDNLVPYFSNFMGSFFSEPIRP